MDNAASIIRERYPNLPALLEAIRKRPAMFLGKTSILGLLLFLGGIDFAETFHEVGVATCLGGFNRVAFEEWVDSTFNTRRISLNSMTLAEHVTGSDEGGFYRWFEWYDTFRQQAQ